MRRKTLDHFVRTSKPARYADIRFLLADREGVLDGVTCIDEARRLPGIGRVGPTITAALPSARQATRTTGSAIWSRWASRRRRWPARSHGPSVGSTSGP